MDIGKNKNNLNLPSADELRTSETRYRRLFESARDGILIPDAVNRKITDADSFMTGFLGCPREAFTGKPLQAISLLSFGQIPDDRKTECLMGGDGADFDVAYAGKLSGVFRCLHTKMI